MSNLKLGGETSVEPKVDLREQLCNERLKGPIQNIAISEAEIVQLYGIMFDIDVALLRENGPLTGCRGIKDPRRCFKEVIQPMLANQPVLAKCEVRLSGSGLHVLLWLDPPIMFEDERLREEWSSIVKGVQCLMPIDPLQPGITAVTRPVGSINGKNDFPVELLQQGGTVHSDEVRKLYQEICQSPFCTILKTWAGDDRVEPCPCCQTEGSVLTAREKHGECYPNCGKVSLAQLCELAYAPKVAKGGRHVM